MTIDVRARPCDQSDVDSMRMEMPIIAAEPAALGGSPIEAIVRSLVASGRLPVACAPLRRALG